VIVKMRYNIVLNKMMQVLNLTRRIVTMMAILFIVAAVVPNGGVASTSNNKSKEGDIVDGVMAAVIPN
jgi:hypothetical protein